jgi:hypothetical protein
MAETGGVMTDEARDENINDKDAKPEKRSVASQLVDMTLEMFDLGCGEDGTPYGSWCDLSHVALPLRGGRLGLRPQLARRYFEKNNTVPSAQALTDAGMVLEGCALMEQPRRLHQRVAQHGGKVYIDIADHEDRVIVISDGKWRFTDRVPVVFKRTELTAPMPDPDRGGADLGLLWNHVNVADPDRPIFLATMVAAFIQPDAPHTILGLLAEHGSAKSTTSRRFVALTDPSVAPLRMAPRDTDQWVTAASGSWVVAIDNLSEISDWLSDALCRAATGEANIKRQLYTDAGLSVFKFLRVIVLNGIDLGGLNGDLTDRLALVELGRITEDDRRDETELEAQWNRDWPAILGGLLNLAATVHHRLPDITVQRMPRMADFSKVLAVIDEINGTTGLDRYRKRAAHLAADSVTSDPLIARLQEINFSCVDTTAAQILTEVTPAEKEWRAPQGWPKNARGVTTQLTKQAPAMRSLGWRIDNDNAANKAKATRWTIIAPATHDQSRNPDPPDPPDPPPQASDPFPGGLDDDGYPVGGLDDPLAGEDDSADPPKTIGSTCEDGLAGQAGQEYNLFPVTEDTDHDDRCDCGNPLVSLEARTRGTCKPCDYGSKQNAGADS